MINRLLALSGLCCAIVSTTYAQPAPDLVSLETSIESLRTAFNEADDKDRLIAIVSSTCGPCVSGAIAVREGIVNGTASVRVANHPRQRSRPDG